MEVNNMQVNDNAFSGDVVRMIVFLFFLALQLQVLSDVRQLQTSEMWQSVDINAVRQL